MALFKLKTWLHSPADRDVIARWTQRLPNQDGIENRFTLVLPPPPDPNNFEFLALGDSGNADSAGGGGSPQDAVAEQLSVDSALPDTRGSAQLVLHMGDVVYMTGERRLYDRNFLKPYSPFLTSESAIGKLTFRIPFLPVPGNHDYYDLNRWLNFLVRIPLLGKGLRRASLELFDFSLPKSGSNMGAAYMEAFVDPNAQPGQPLKYLPGEATRIPNRYYQFSNGNTDFFALDSNTLDAPPPWAGETENEKTNARVRLEALLVRSKQLDDQLKIEQLACDQMTEAQEAKIEGSGLEMDACERRRHIAREALDVQRAIAREEQRLRFGPEDYDSEQIEWLRATLEASVRDRPNSWRIVYLHHPFYTSIKNHCERSDVRDIRANLIDLMQGKVHLILAGHSHAFEWFRSDHLPDTGLFVTGGGGQISLRPSILSPSHVRNHRDEYEALRRQKIAECAVAGRGPNASDGEDGKLYHYLKIQVTPHSIFVRPIGVRRVHSGFRREEPMPVFHIPNLPPDAPQFEPRLLESVEIRRGCPPTPHWKDS